MSPIKKLLIYFLNHCLWALFCLAILAPSVRAGRACYIKKDEQSLAILLGNINSELKHRFDRELSPLRQEQEKSFVRRAHCFVRKALANGLMRCECVLKSIRETIDPKEEQSLLSLSFEEGEKIRQSLEELYYNFGMIADRNFLLDVKSLIRDFNAYGVIHMCKMYPALGHFLSFYLGSIPERERAFLLEN